MICRYHSSEPFRFCLSVVTPNSTRIGSFFHMDLCPTLTNFLYLRGKYVQQPPLRPAVILLDLNLPGTDGREVLEEVKRDPKLKSIPIVVISTSSNPIDIETSYQNGANSYIVKEVNFTAFKIAMQIFEDYWFRITTLPNEPF
ncbi:MAG: response regulator [Anaerolineae bacterium]|nr:response regulator [Anaerolineae bacterium]